VIVLLANPSLLPVLGFVPGSIIFDLVLLVDHHKVNMKRINMGIAALGAIVAAYVAAVVNGIFILNFAPMFTLTIWAGFVVLGGIIGVVIALPIIGVLEKAQVKKVKTA